MTAHLCSQLGEAEWWNQDYETRLVILESEWNRLMRAPLEPNTPDEILAVNLFPGTRKHLRSIARKGFRP